MYKVILLLVAVGARITLAAPVMPPSAADVQISIAPASPIIFSAPYSFTNADGATIAVASPWFRMQFFVDNRSTDFVTIVHLYMQTVAPDGSLTTFNYNPPVFDFTLRCERGVRVPINYALFGEFGPHGKGYLKLSYQGGPLPRECGAQNPNIDTPVFYFGGLPGSGTNTYRGRVTVVGWFGPGNEPHDRFQKTIEFVTQ